MIFREISSISNSAEMMIVKLVLAFTNPLIRFRQSPFWVPPFVMSSRFYVYKVLRPAAGSSHI
jgi:hypothetical protein